MRTLARSRGQTVSTLVTGAIAHELRLAALDDALAAADQRFGAVPGDRVDEAEGELLRASRLARPKARRTRR